MSFLSYSFVDILVKTYHFLIGLEVDYTFHEDMQRYNKGEIFWFEVRKSDLEVRSHFKRCDLIDETAKLDVMVCNLEGIRMKLSYHTVEVMKWIARYLFENKNEAIAFISMFTLIVILCLEDWKMQSPRRIRRNAMDEQVDESKLVKKVFRKAEDGEVHKQMNEMKMEGERTHELKLEKEEEDEGVEDEEEIEEEKVDDETERRAEEIKVGCVQSKYKKDIWKVFPKNECCREYECCREVETRFAKVLGC